MFSLINIVIILIVFFNNPKPIFTPNGNFKELLDFSNKKLHHLINDFQKKSNLFFIITIKRIFF